MPVRLLVGGLVLTAGFTGTPALATGPASTSSSEAPIDVVVLLKPQASVGAEAREASRRGADVSDTYRGRIDGFAAQVPLAQLEQLRRDPQVLAVEPDAPVTLLGTTGATPWGLDRIDQRSLPLSGTAGYQGAGAGVTAYVLDTGIAGHEEFGSRLGAGYSSIDDGRGTGDCHGHGTHVAGVVAGATTGVAPAATPVPVRVLGCDGTGTMSGLLAGLEWVVANHQPGVPAVANLSLSSSASESLDAGVQGLLDDGITVVTAAGNAANDACTSSPARVASALTTGASDVNDAVAPFSNQGSCVDLFAPGVQISSAWPSSTVAQAVGSGTSMAAPHAAGAAAALLSRKPQLLPAEVSAQLLADSTTGHLTGLQSGSPDRLLHLAPAGSTPSPAPAPAAATVPGAPGDVRVSTDGTTARLTWSSAPDRGSPLTGYTVRTLRSGVEAAIESVPADATGWTVTGLKPGTTYEFTVTASNAIGAGSPSVAVAVVTAATAPSPPKSVKAKVRRGVAKVRWSPATDGGSALTGYLVQARVVGKAKPVASIRTAPGKHRLVVRGLPPRTKLRFTVRSLNDLGTSRPATSPRFLLTERTR